MPILTHIQLSAGRPLDEQSARVEKLSFVICALIEKFFGRKVRTPNFRKISIEISATVDELDGKVVGNVLIHREPLPIQSMELLTKADRPEILLDHICLALTKVLEKYQIDKRLIAGAKQFVLDKEYVNWVVGDRYPEPHGTRTAHVEAKQTLEDASVVLVLFDGRREIFRYPIATTAPDEYIFKTYFQKIFWFDDKLEITDWSGARFDFPLPPTVH